MNPSHGTLADHALVTSLRGSRELRPKVDPALAGGLRAWLDDDLAGVVGSIDPAAPVFASPRSLISDRDRSAAPTLAIARGALLGELVRQRVVLGGVEHPMDDALAALEADPRHASLVAAIHALEPDGFAHLAAEVAAHDTVVARALGAIPPSWLPRTHVRLSVPVAGGRVVLGATVTIMVGPPAANVASVCLINVTTSALDDAASAQLGILCLIETLRSSTPPLRAAVLSSATGEIERLDVGDAVLFAAIDDVVGGVTRQAGHA